MEITPRLTRQALLLSMVLVIVPMVVFPEQLGTSLVRASLVNALYELVFFSAMLFILNRGASLFQLVQAGAVCLVYRLTLGALFGFMISAMYSMNVSVSLTLGLSGYMPSIILQILAAPFVLQPLLRETIFGVPHRAQAALTPDAMASEAEMEGTGNLRPSPIGQPIAMEPTLEFPQRTSRADTGTPVYGGDGFDRAARYIGEDGAVELAVVVDNEGLILGKFQRGTNDAEAWAPFAVVLHEKNSAILQRAGFSEPERLDLVLSQHKLTIAYDRQFALMVVAERLMNDTLSIRVSQGLEMIRQHIAQRYSQELLDNVERSHV